MTRTLKELAVLVEGQVDGDEALVISGVAGLDDAQPGQLSFYSNPRYKKELAQTRASVVLTTAEPKREIRATFLRVASPQLAFARISALFHPARAWAPERSSQAFIHPEARVDASATVMPFVTVSRGATVGPRAVLWPGVFVGEDANVGADTQLRANVCIADGCEVGARCLLHPGVVVGSDGFGFAFDSKKPEHVKIPQVGIARVEDDVEIGACSCIDRATTGQTVIGHGSRLDNLVQVGHNCVVGPFSILCSQVGLSGSTTLGKGVVMAGQAGSAGHLHVGDGAKIGGQAGLMSDIEPGAAMLGAPAWPLKDFMRSWAIFGRLPTLVKDVRDLARRLTALEGAQHPSKEKHS